MFFSLVLEYPWLVVLSRRCGAWTGNGVYCGQDCGYCKRTRAVLSSGCPHYYKINMERRLCPLTQSVPGLSVTPSFSLDIYISLSRYYPWSGYSKPRENPLYFVYTLLRYILLNRLQLRLNFYS